MARPLLVAGLALGAGASHCSTYLDFPHSAAMTCGELLPLLLSAAASLGAECAAAEQHCGYSYAGPEAEPFRLKMRHTTRSASSSKTDVLDLQLLERAARGRRVGCYAHIESRSEQWELFADEGRNFCGMAVLANATGLAHRITPVSEGARCRVRRPELCARGVPAPFGVELGVDPEPVPFTAAQWERWWG